MQNKKIMISIIGIIILMVLMIISILVPGSNYTSDSFEIYNRNVLKNLKKNDVVEESFIPEKNYSKIGIPFASYGQIIRKGYVRIVIKNESGKRKKYKIKLSKIMDNEYYFLKYKFQKNKRYTVYIEVKNNNLPITIYTTEKEIKNASLKINGKEQKENILLSFLYKKKDYFSIWYYLFAINIILLYIVMIKDNGEKYEKRR